MITRTLALAALSLSALAAHAAGDAALASTESGLTREAVVADLVASRQQPNTLPRDGEWYNVPAPLAIGQRSATAVAAQPDNAKAVATTGERSGAAQ